MGSTAKRKAVCMLTTVDDRNTIEWLLRLAESGLERHTEARQYSTIDGLEYIAGFCNMVARLRNAFGIKAPERTVANDD